MQGRHRRERSPGPAHSSPPPLLARFAILGPLAAAGSYLLLFLFNLDRLRRATFLNSDVSSIPLLTQDMLRGGPSSAHIGVASYASTFFFGFATRSLPFHRTVWELWSLGLSWAAAGLLAWATWRVAGKWPAILAGAIAVSASPIVIYNYAGLRGPTWFTGALLLATLVLLATLPAGGRWWPSAAVVVGVGIAAGINLASDPLLAVSGLAPFVAAAIGGALLLRRRSGVRVLVAAGGVALVMVASALLTARAMHGIGFQTFKNVPLGVAGASQVRANLGMFGHGLLAFANGEFPKPAGGLVSWAGLALALLCLFALAAPLRLVGALRGTPRPRSESQTLALALFTLFWAFTVLGVGAAFLFSDLPVGGVASARYLVPLFFAIAAGVGLWGDLPWPRTAAAGVVTLFCLMSIGGQVVFMRNLQTPMVGMQEPQLAAEGPALVSFLEDHGLTRGFAGYWESLGLTWSSGLKVHIYPVLECGVPPARSLCQYPINAVSSWYRPVPATKTFFLVSHAQRILGEPESPPPTYLGSPDAEYRVKGFTVYVYDYDVAAKLKAP